MSKKILIVDDEKNMIWALKNALKNEDYKIESASNGEEGIEKVKNIDPDLVLLDLKMPKLNGIEALKKIRVINPKISVIIMTAHGTVETAIEAMKNGAIDYISKPFDVDELKVQIRKALDIEAMKEKIAYLTEELENQTGKTIIGKSQEIQDVLDRVKLSAKSNATILITGESGTGKELIANAIHYNSPRKDQPYIKVNCGAIPETLIESELFGHEKGAFTSAIKKKIGKFERANNGTVFLDEIGELNLAMQVKLLRVLQDQKIERVGGEDVIELDLRVVAATNKDLKKMTEENKFREDLYYRLNIIPIELPPLRERKEDVPLLINHFIDKYCQTMGRKKIKLSPKAEELLINYEWKGNIRELENVIERMIILSTSDTITKDNLPKEILFSNIATTEFILPQSGINLEAVEKSFIEQALQLNDHNQTKAAKLLGITRHTLLYRIEKYAIEN